MPASDCLLCRPGNPLKTLWSNRKLRVVDAAEAGFPGFTRVIWNEHIAEMSDLDGADRDYLMNAVWLVEAALRNELMPQKVNLAQFGNQVPHLHWHVIPRWPLDSRFPQAFWAPPVERSPEQVLAWDVFQEQLENRLPDYWHTLRHALDTLPPSV